MSAARSSLDLIALSSGVTTEVKDGRLIPSFPFFDFFTPGNNYTSFYFDITVSI